MSPKTIRGNYILTIMNGLFVVLKGRESVLFEILKED